MWSHQCDLFSLSPFLLPSVPTLLLHYQLSLDLLPAPLSISWFSFHSSPLASFSNIPRPTWVPVTEKPGQPRYDLSTGGGHAKMEQRRGWEGFPKVFRPRGQGVCPLPLWAVESHHQLFSLCFGAITLDVFPFLSHALSWSNTSLCSLTTLTPKFPLWCIWYPWEKLNGELIFQICITHKWNLPKTFLFLTVLSLTRWSSLESSDSFLRLQVLSWVSYI